MEIQTNPDLAAVAALIADPSRAAMLSALLGGEALPAGELARAARVSPQTAAAHLAKLVRGGLLVVTTQGRHRYFRLSGPPVARMLESMALVAPAGRVRSLRHSLENRALRRARTCYDHLAGALGVAITQALVERDWILEHVEAYEVTGPGTGWFQALGVDCDGLQQGRRKFAPRCLDWSERRPHIAGALGAALARRMLALGLIARLDSTRALTVTPAGCAYLKNTLDIAWE